MASFIQDPFGPTSTSTAFKENTSSNFAFVPDNLSKAIGNPAFDSVVSNTTNSFNTQKSSERLFVNRARYSSNDITDRGTHAYIKLMTSSEQAAKYTTKSSSRTLMSSSDSSVLAESLAVMTTGAGQGYDKLLITSVSASMEEKIQISEVFGDNEVVYYFGRAPMIFTMTGMLIDSIDNNWFTDWLYTYEGSLRGSQLARNHELLKLVLPSMTLVGSITNFSWEQQSVNDTSVPFRFQFLVRSIVPTPAIFSGSVITNAVNQIDFSSEQSFKTWSNIMDLKSQSAVLSGVFQNSGSINQLGAALYGYGSGLAAYSGIGASPSVVSNAIDGLSGLVSSNRNALSDLISPITSSLNGIRATLFSPIYGVLNSLTKLVLNVFGSINSILSKLTSPVRGILGDISRIFSQASAIVGLVTSGLSSLGRKVSTGFGILQSYNTAIASFKHCAGTIAAAPLNVSNSLKNLVNSGHIYSSASFLNPSPKYSLSKSYSLRLSSSVSPQIAILSGGSKITVSAGAYL